MKELRNNNLISKLTAAFLSTLLIVAIVAANTASLYAYTKIGRSKKAAPDIVAQNAVMYSDDLEKTIYAKNENDRCEPYSITKLMTAWLVCENLDMDQVVTVSKNAANPPGDSMRINLQEGEKISVKNLMYGMLLSSGNDAATALGEAVAGSEEKFAKLMTETAKSWGCTNTSFANAHGMSDAKHYTTAADFLIIANKAFAVDTIREITATKQYTIPATNKYGTRECKNHTTHINDEGLGVVRGKTGTWDDEDCSVVLQYEKNELKLTLVLIHDTKQGRLSDTTALLNYAHKITPGYLVASTKESAGTLWIKGGKRTRIPVYVDKDVNAYPKDDKEGKIKVKLIKNDDVVAPLKKGAVVGKYEVYVDKKLIATRNLVVKQNVDKGLFTANAYISDRAALVILLVIIAYVILLFVVAKQRKKRTRRKRRYN